MVTCDVIQSTLTSITIDPSLRNFPYPLDFLQMNKIDELATGRLQQTH